jgi:cell division protein FtsI (penicillin-binding protein 3)
VNSYGLNKKLNMDFQGEGRPFIPQTTDKKLVEHITSLDGFGYGVSVTPMQTLTFIMLLQIME